MNQEQAIRLLQQYREGTTTPGENTFIEKWFDELVATANIDWTEQEKQFYRNRIFENLENQVSTPVYTIRTRRWLPYAAAVLLILAAGTYFWIQQKEKPSVTHTSPVPVQNDVAPGGNKAILTLADGRKIILDSAKSGELARETNATITKTGDGRIIYNPDKKIGNRILYNTMVTPRGGQYQLTLPDGSQVWLNAESSITYPTAFTGSERKVSITGEAYFEVKKNKTKPFKVETNSLTIEVLGTHFNVNTYPEEPTIRTTLLEGSVRLTAHGSQLTTDDSLTAHGSRLTNKKSVLKLIPGQQAIIKSGEAEMQIISKVNTQEIIAWKNGSFYFDNQDLKSILRQFARWYDVEVKYEGTLKNRTFFGIVNRDKSLAHVLKLLEDNNIQFRIEGRKLTVQSD